MKVVAGYCAGDSVLTRFMASYTALLRRDMRHRQLIVNEIAQEGLYIDNNRDAVVRTFLNMDADALLSLDTDISFAPDLLDLLIEHLDPDERPIVSALYINRMGEERQLTPVWLVKGRGGDNGYPYETAGEIYHSEAQKLEGIGMGACLIHRNVFERMKGRYDARTASWCDSPWIWFGRDAVRTKRGIESMGEDVCFCARAIESGFSIWGHGGIQVTHHKREALDFDRLVTENLVRQAKQAVAEQQAA